MTDGIAISALDFDALLNREWLAVNSVGGYASSSLPGLNTRRYHGLLVAAMSPPVRRMVLLSRVEETVHWDGQQAPLACNEYPGAIYPRGHEYLRAFNCEPFPRWAYQGPGWTIEKQVRLLSGENTVLLSYILLGGVRPIDLEIRPLFALRGIHEVGYQRNGELLADQSGPGQYRIPATRRTPDVFFAHDGVFDPSSHWYLNTIYRREPERGYPGLEDLWSPGIVRYRIAPGRPVHFACSAEPLDLTRVVSASGRQYAAAVLPSAAGEILRDALSSPTVQEAESNVAPLAAVAARDADLEALLRAADAFVLSTRAGDSLGCVGQYHWSPPSVRNALAGFSGLFLAPRRFTDGRALLLSLLPRIAGALLPIEFPEDGSAPIYGGADVALWFINACHQYIAYTADDATLRRYLFDAVRGLIDAVRGGLSAGVSVDNDGLLVTSDPGVSMTWMNATIAGKPVTPRSGRAVEINALWYNALRGGADLARRLGQRELADAWITLADRVETAFNVRFWNDAAHCCFDVVGDDGPDAAVRPNQLLALSLPFPVLQAARAAAVVEKVRTELLTPFGVRTLSPLHPAYRGRSSGGASARDAAYHNGSSYPWLLGPLITATLRARGQSEAARTDARRLLEPCIHRLRTDGMGQLCELFDGDAPHHPGGAVAAPLGVAEILRCYVEDVLGLRPQASAGARPVHADARSAASSDVAYPAR